MNRGTVDGMERERRGRDNDVTVHGITGKANREAVPYSRTRGEETCPRLQSAPLSQTVPVRRPILGEATSLHRST